MKTMALRALLAFREPIHPTTLPGGFMRLFRYACAGLATSVLAASALTGPASAQVAGVGTSSTSTQLLTAQLGEGGALLDLSLLSDEARSTIDAAVASPEAFTRLTALDVAASLIPSSPINLTAGVYEAKSSGPSQVDITGSTLAVPLTDPIDLAPVLSATIDPGKLTASLTDGVAAASMDTSVSGVSAVGGLVSVDLLESLQAASSAGTGSTANRSATVKDVAVLDLGALLQYLGLPLEQLTVDQLVDLVDSLGLSDLLGLPTGSETLDAAVTTINATIDDLQEIIDDTLLTTDPLVETIDSTVDGLLGTDAPTTELVDMTDDELQGLIDDLQVLLEDLIAEGLLALDDVALLRLAGVDVGVTTKAVDTVEGSVAQVTGKIGSVFIGGIELPGIDLVAAAADVNALVTKINTELGAILSLVDPDLANLVKVSVLDKATSVTQANGYTTATAGISAATATVTPPADIAAIVQAIIDETDDVAALLGDSLPVLDQLMDALQATLNVTSSALAAPAQVKIASVLSASNFRVAAAPTTPVGSPTLPRTGGSDLVLLAGLLGVLALGIRRFLHAPEVKAVEVRR